MLLLHSINAAASAYEVAPIATALRGRRVYVPDLPGYGFSDRAPRAYTIRLFVDAVHDMLGVIAEEAGAAPVHALAVSLASEFLARAAMEAPGRFRSLTFVTPTGFSRGSDKRRGEPGRSLEVPGLHAVLTVPPWSQALFDLLVSERSIRYFLKRTFGAPDVPDDLVRYAYATAHQPGARHAPYAFLAGRLFSRDVRVLYEALALPVYVPHATRGDFKDFSESGWAAARGNWRFRPYPTGAMPHFELCDAFVADLEAFLAGA